MALAESSERGRPAQAISIRYEACCYISTDLICATEGLQATAAEALMPKAPTTKRKGKRGGAPRQRPVRITNVHLKGEIDLSRDYVAPGK